FGERNGAARAIWLVAKVALTSAQFRDGPRQIAVPFERIHSQIEMGVEDQIHAQIIRQRVSAASVMSRPAIPTIVSITVQVRNVCVTVRPRQSLTIQNPPSLRRDRKSEIGRAHVCTPVTQ